jgi:hypothetical protein
MDDQETSDPVVASGIETVEEAQLESRAIPKLDSPELPHGLGVKLLVKLSGTRVGPKIVVISALVFITITFLPVLVLCIIDGTALPGKVKVPLLGDYISMSRMLIVAPMLILSDLLTRPWLIKTAEHFLGTFINPDDADRYNQIFKKVFRMRNSVALDAGLFVVAFLSSIFNASMVLAMDVSSWHLTNASGTSTLSPPGMWNAGISQPLFRYIILSWVVDYLLWVYFLFKVSRFKLNVIATHPDGAGGLAFVSVAQTQFCIAAFALSAAVSSVIAHAVLYAGVKLQSFTNLGLVFLAAILLTFIGPLLVFTPTLAKTKLRAVFSYGSLSHEMSKLFANKWLATRSKDDEPIISSGDPSALADLNSSYQTVSDMSPFVFGRRFVMTFIAAAALPALPLVATVIPLKELLMQIFKMLS